MRRNNSKGGMITSGLHNSLYCPKCGKPAYRRDDLGGQYGYWHFTKNSSVCHKVDKPKSGE